ncbi:MAG: alkaline phosphatase [Flavobacterium sp.]|nr:MAG: alkaline phosphatase [Flavobacterium sp.]
MKYILLVASLIILISCKDEVSKKLSEANKTETSIKENIDFTMVFASCSDQRMKQPLWKPIIETKPDVFVWGGDNIYADTDDMLKMKADYESVWAQPEYQKLASKTRITGTWDDHDYGKNDAGKEWHVKKEAQQEFLDFLRVSKNDIRRTREGVYSTETFTTKNGSVKLIMLDTRTFRDSLLKSSIEGRRYDHWPADHLGTVLGETQWNWLEKELDDDSATFTVIVSSIQFLANEHYWEKWGYFLEEAEKLNQLIINAKANNIFILSGDRHLAEFSKKELDGLNYPLIDFTASGMTKVYPDSPEDINKYRLGNQVKKLNFGVIKFDFKNQNVIMEIRGENNVVYDVLEQKY